MKKLPIFLFLSVFSRNLAQVVPSAPTVGPTTTTLEMTTTTVGVLTTTTMRPPPAPVPTAPTGNAPPATTLAPSPTTTTSGPFQCPPTGVSYHPTSHCQFFVTCINGNRHDGQCLTGFLFDAIRLNCEPEVTVDCGDRTRP